MSKNNSNQGFINTTENDTIEVVYLKINSGETLKEKLKIYSIIRTSNYHRIDEINNYIEENNPLLWREITRLFYPSLWDFVKSWMR